MTITIALAGDTMLGRGVAAEITAAWRGELFASEIRDLVKSADLAVLNLECCISARGQPYPGRRFHFCAPPQAAEIRSNCAFTQRRAAPMPRVAETVSDSV